jgi:hypothetical protein
MTNEPNHEGHAHQHAGDQRGPLDAPVSAYVVPPDDPALPRRSSAHPLPRHAAPDEQTFLRRVLLALSQRPDLRVWRQNVGTLPVRDAQGHVERVFRAGPPKGAADLSGIIRPEGWRLEIELKAAHGRLSPEQERWARFIRASGGVYVLAKYDASQTVEENTAAAVRTVEAAVGARRQHAPGGGSP